MNRQDAVALAWNISDFAGGKLDDFAESNGEIWLPEDRDDLIRDIERIQTREPHKRSECNTLLQYVRSAVLDGDGNME